jgi:hypothetical protein
MKSIAAVLFVALLAMAWRLNWLNASVGQQQQTLIRLQQQLAGLTDAKLSKQDAFAMQEKCAAQADKVFRELGYKLNGSTDNVSETLQSHFNPQLNKCFMAIETMARNGSQSRFVLDAFEQREYAEYFWMVDKVKKYWENPPKVCKEIPSSGDERLCHSDDDYKAIRKRYLE